MRIVILASSLQGLAPLCLSSILTKPEIEIALIIFNQGLLVNKHKRFRRVARKIFKIGIVGALNGVRMRSWYKKCTNELLNAGNLKEIAFHHNIPFASTPAINHPQTISLFKGANADLGLSLGNGYICEKLFSIPKKGMINVHHEMLPQFRGALSVIWQMYHHSSETGYTIHKIDKYIDNGPILFQKKMPILFKPTLKETVVSTYAELMRDSAKELAELLVNYNTVEISVQPQGKGCTYTTPTIWQYFRMLLNHKKLSKTYTINPDYS